MNLTQKWPPCFVHLHIMHAADSHILSIIRSDSLYCSIAEIYGKTFEIEIRISTPNGIFRGYSSSGDAGSSKSLKGSSLQQTTPTCICRGRARSLGSVRARQKSNE